MLSIIGKTINNLYGDIEKEYNMDYKEIIRGCADKDKSNEWIKCIDSLVEITNLSSNLGDIELAKYLPQLIEKAYNFGKN
jgi:hypothetical protein